MVCSFWCSEPFTGLQVENTPLPGAYRVKVVGPLKPLRKDFCKVITIYWLSDVRQKTQRKKLVTEISIQI